MLHGVPLSFDKGYYSDGEHIHWTFMYLGHALSAPELYYSLLVLNVCDFNSGKFFSSSRRNEGVGKADWASFTCGYSEVQADSP
jgi:hypothetical protein